MEERLEILYRIYRVRDKKAESEGSAVSDCFDELVCQEAMVCDSREKFKEMMRDLYGENLKFKASKKYEANTVYCVIIGELSYDQERYFNFVEYECAQCGKKVRGTYKCGNKLSDWDIRSQLGAEYGRYNSLNFCSGQCVRSFLVKESRKYQDENDGENCWITREDFRREGVAGYVYKITRKSTGEFYVGQTVYNPIFRWGQHLKGGRFDIKNIEDYKFEVIEIVHTGESLLEREKYWIQRCYREAPEKSLNIMCTAGLEQFKMENVE